MFFSLLGNNYFIQCLEEKALKIKVAEVLSDTNIGGAGRLLLTRFRLSDRDKFEQRIILPRGSELESCFIELGYEPSSMRYCMNRSFDIREVISLRRYFKHSRPDIVNCHGCLSARIAAKLAGVPICIYTRHCAYTPSAFMTNALSKKLTERFTDSCSDKIIAVADAAKENLIDMGISPEKVEVIINGVIPVEKYSADQKSALRRELGIDKDAFVCGICARLEECKGIDVLLRAARKLLRSNSDNNYYFMIVGKGSRDSDLKGLADALGISSKVKFCGFASDVTPYLNCFDVNINCSRGTETSSLALSEGMSIGLPCIASDWGGNPYMVKDGYNGFIFPTDDFLSLANRIERLAGDKSLYKEMSKNAYRRFCDELTAEKMTRKTEELYSKLYASLS